MASITIRKLDSKTKKWLRIRAAQNGRSMEEEARVLFDQLQANENSAATISAVKPQKIAPIPVVKSLTSSPESQFEVTDIADAASEILIGKHILLIISGGIAAYKCLELIRRLRERGATIRTVMTRSAAEFVTPLSIGALTAERVYTDLFSRDDEHDIGHIRLSREADLVVVAPATANLMAKMAHGLADDLASAILLATNRPVLIAPAMNPLMWQHPATLRNRQTLIDDGIYFIGPGSGEMAESGEAGTGRLAEPIDILAAIETMLDDRPKPLTGMKAVVTSGPTREAIDPVRYLSNHSSGKQGHAIAASLVAAGAEVMLISGPVSIADPAGTNIIHVENAIEMQQAVEAAMPADIAIFVAAVADWRPVKSAEEKIKKTKGENSQELELIENQDILRGVGTSKTNRPSLVVGFAAETQDLIKNGTAKLDKKGADWILANDVSADTGVMGGDRNTIRLISNNGVEDWPRMGKQQVANRLVSKIVEFFARELIEI